MTQIKYPMEEGDPYIWLQEDEEEGTAECGCHLELDNGAKLTFCTMHAAAPEFLEAAVALLDELAQLVPRVQSSKIFDLIAVVGKVVPE